MAGRMAAHIYDARHARDMCRERLDIYRNGGVLAPEALGPYAEHVYALQYAALHRSIVFIAVMRVYGARKSAFSKDRGLFHRSPEAYAYDDRGTRSRAGF